MVQWNYHAKELIMNYEFFGTKRLEEGAYGYRIPFCEKGWDEC